MAPSPTAATVAATPTSPAATAATAGAAATPTEAVQTLTLGSTTYNDHGTIDVTGKDEVTLEADNFYFDPTFLRGTPGQKVTLEIENESRILHNISVDGQSVDMDVQPSGKTTVEVTFPPSGVVRFYCKYHATQGMNGEMLAGQATPQPAQ